MPASAGSLAFEKKRDAEAARTRIETELAGGIHTADRASATVAQACDLWYTSCEARVPPLEPWTLVNYKRAKNRIATELGTIKLNQLNSHCDQFPRQNHQTGDGVSQNRAKDGKIDEVLWRNHR